MVSLTGIYFLTFPCTVYKLPYFDFDRLFFGKAIYCWNQNGNRSFDVSDSDPRKKKIKIKDILHEPPDEKN